MPENTVERKLRAILSADVKGYSRMMGEDEVGTYQTLTTNLKSIRSIISEHKGRVFTSPGDAVMAEFSSVVDAVQCAVELQDNIETANAEVPNDRKMQFRIGVNLGDVIHDGEQVYGDGVNIAARIETLAEPGKVSISRNVYNQVRNKLKFGYEYQGEHQVKNIVEPVSVYKVLTAPEDAGQLIGEPKAPKRLSKQSYISIFAALALIVAAAIWQLYPRAPEIEPASVESMALPLPDKPSIAVLPFENMSGDPNQKYFSDGFTEHIITSLSKVPYIFVIARQSSFSFREKQMTVQQIAKELGVRYILEGSIQRSGERLRITVQLIDASSGHHIWADNYDRNLTDIFALQDEIAMKIMAELQLKLTVEEIGKLSGTKTKNIRAYEKFLMAYEYWFRRTEGDSQQAKKLAQEAISLDAEYGAAYKLLANCYLDDVWFYRTKSAAKSLDTAEQLIQKSIDLSGPDATAHHLLGSVYHLRRQYDKAVTECRKSVDMSPNSAEANFKYGRALRYAGRFDEAILFFKKAIRINPITPMNYLNNIAWAYAFSEQYEEAISIWNKAIERNPDYFFAYLGLTLAYQLSGNELKAREAAAEVIRLKPNLTISKLEKGPATKGIDRKRMMGELRKAGIPD